MDNFWIARVQDGQAWLTPADALHCTRVMRYRLGDMIGGIDGNGYYYEGPLVVASGPEAAFSFTTPYTNYGEPSFTTALYISPLRQRDRLEWLVEKAVELGLTHLVLTTSAHTEPGAPNLGRLTRVMQAALKQCQRSRLPQLQQLPFAEALKVATAAGPTLLASQVAPQSVVVFQNLIAQVNCNYFVGPEGDYTPDELALALSAGVQLATLGKNRLRSETAALQLLALNKAWKGF